MVDENRIKGAAQDALGKVEESVGAFTGDTRMGDHLFRTYNVFF